MQPSPTLLSWARQRFAQTDLGDARRTRRLVHTAARVAQSPSASLPRAHEGLADVTGAYRFLNNDAINPQDILGGHRKLTDQAAATHDVILCVQDTTTLDFTGRECEGLGQTGNGPTRGLLQHAALAVTEDGQPLGVISCFWHRRVKPPMGEKRNQRSKRPTEAEIWKDTAEAIGPFDAARLLRVGDRLADVFEFMQDAPEEALNLLAAHQRAGHRGGGGVAGGGPVQASLGDRGVAQGDQERVQARVGAAHERRWAPPLGRRSRRWCRCG